MISGKILRDSFISGAISIANNKKAVDELNVYPVPDGDTGTNMSMTMNNAMRELELLEDNCTVSSVASVTSSALLRGARGNSGVILSLLFRGFATALKGKNEATLEDLSEALSIGVDGDYKAVMKPTEGTILTVARVTAEKVAENLSDFGNSVELWKYACEQAKITLDETPELLPVLKKAGVVDAGGEGLLIIWKAMLEVFEGKPIAVSANKTANSAPAVNLAVSEADEEINFAYCTEYIVNKDKDCADASALRAYLETLGDCVVAVEDDDIIKVHVHTNNPGLAIEKGITFGPLTNLKIDNMKFQHTHKVLEATIAKTSPKFVPVAPEKPFGFVAVASGAGIEAMFSDLGVDNIVTGGQTMNPSTDDILAAIMATPAETVFVLPNNKNIIMAAEQAVSLADRKVCVLQTTTIPQGITAMLAFDPSEEFEDIRFNMSKAIENVTSGLVTFAARDSDFDGNDIKKGEILGLLNGKLTITDKDVTKTSFKLLKKMVDSKSSFITIIYGTDISESDAEEFAEFVRSKMGDKCEVTLINGGQPVYYYILSVE